MKRSLFSLGLAAAALVAGCGAAPPRVSLRVTGNMKDATVTIDDQYIGSFAYVQRKGVSMLPGRHRITVERNGYFPWDKVIEATDQPIKLDVQLVPIPD